jgi:prevent-host-death family protein
MPTVNMLDAKTQLSRLVQQVESGEEAEIVIARNGRPVAKLVPVNARAKTPRRLGMLEGRYPSFTLEEFNAADAEIARLFGIDP